MQKRKQPPRLTENAKIILRERYLRDETRKGLFERVAQAVAHPEGKNRARWAACFFEMMTSLRFLPNSPTLMNAGTKNGQLSACFVIPIEDSLVSIFDGLKWAALIHQSGGGTGFSFSQLRPRGSGVRSTRGVASGPVSFMRIFDQATNTVKQGGTRRGANMGILRVDHPDIIDFIECKMDMHSITNFNISVGITSRFMDALRSGRSYQLVDPHTKHPVKSVLARDIFSKIVTCAWTCGDPGLVFLDRVNQVNPTPQLGCMESTNPCGEQPLLPFESCNLGSLNLGAYFQNGGFDWALYRQDIWNAIRFLDNVIDQNCFPILECEQITRANRKVGLGVMGLADLLLMMGVAYDSEEARRVGGGLMKFLDHEAKAASAMIAVEKGAFSNWKGSRWDRLGFPMLRNATVSTVAPTGTISLIAGASGGIEPIYSGVITRNILGGQRLVEIHPTVAKILKLRGCELRGDSSELIERQIEAELGSCWSPAHRVSIDGHIRMQAAFQEYSDSGVSKTVNLPNSATEADVEFAYLLADELKCKGVTIYRDRSRPAQVLEHCPTC